MKTIFCNKYAFIVIILIFIAIITFIIYKLNNSDIAPPGDSITEEKLSHDLREIISDELKIQKTEIVLNGHYPEFLINNHGTIDKDERVIIMYSKIRSMSNNYSKPYNVQEAMRIWLYLTRRTLPYEVTAVYFATTRSSGFDKLWGVLVEKNEFEEIYHSKKDSKLEDEQFIRQLADIWITQHKYEGWWGNKN